MKALTGLHIVNFNARAIKKSTAVDDEIDRLRKDMLLETFPPMQSLPSSTYITLALLNIRSLIAKLADVEVDQELNSADVLCSCETWLSPYQPSPVIKANDVDLRYNRTINDHKGGTMMSVPTSMHPNRAVTFISNGIESLVTTLHVNGKCLQVALVYRSPGVPMCQFLELMTNLLECLSTTDLPSIVLGDMNDDILCNIGSQLERFMLSHGYTQLVKNATTDKATLIDHVYFNNMQCDDVLVQVCDVYYSDHDAVYCSVPICIL